MFQIVYAVLCIFLYSQSVNTLFTCFYNILKMATNVVWEDNISYLDQLGYQFRGQQRFSQGGEAEPSEGCSCLQLRQDIYIIGCVATYFSAQYSGNTNFSAHYSGNNEEGWIHAEALR